jgi:hypothetical protein
MGRFLALLILVFACSPAAPAAPDGTTPGGDASTDPDDGAASGTRLKLTWYAFSDGTRQWSGLYDSERKEYCSPYLGSWPDGNNYCVPANSGDVVYSDANCTKVEADEFVGSTCSAPAERYALDEIYDDCSGEYLPTHLYLKGAALSATTYYEKFDDGSCNMFTVDPSFEQLYAVTSEVMPSTDLVQLTLSTPAGSGSFGVRSWESSDGAKLPSLLHDAANNVDCSPDYYGDTATTASCTPPTAQYAYLDHDIACQQAVLPVTSTCTAPSYSFTFPATSCPADLGSYFATGTKLSSPALYEEIGTTCVSTTADTGTSYFQLGSALALSQLQRTPDSDSTHRIQIVHYDSTDGGLHFRDPTYLYDSQEKTVCMPEKLADGTVRCVPDSGIQVTSGYYFSGSTCAAASAIDVVDIYTGPATCAPPQLPAYVRKYIATTGCEANFELHQLTAKIGTLYYLGGATGTTCTKYTPFEEVFYGTGPAISTSDFVTAAITTDN